MIFKIFFMLSFATAAGENCDHIKSYRDFYQCSVLKHPSFTVSKLKREEGEALFDKSTQWKNPEIEVKSVGGKNAGESVGSTEIAVSVPISQIWVKGAERDLGRAEKKIADIESQESLMNVQKEVLKDLYRYRQVEEELALVVEAIDAFGKIGKQFKGRLARGPEHEITLSLVELATGDYELKKNHLTTEKSEITARLRGIWGSDVNLKKEWLPPVKEKWPEIKTNSSLISFESKKLIAESERAFAEEKLSIRESWPELRAGPVLERNTEGPSQFWSYGVNVSMNLPLFSLNGGARKLAESRASQARLMGEYAQKKSSLDRDILIQRYTSAVESLKKSSSRDDLRRKHEKIDSLFRQGLAGGGIIIEAHRQITEFTESQHEHEIAALESYIEWQVLNGENIEEILK